MMPILKNIDFKKRARHVDKVARVMFPLIFFLFNTGFWVFYLSINTDNKFWDLKHSGMLMRQRRAYYTRKHLWIYAKCSKYSAVC